MVPQEPEVRPGALEGIASPVWLATPITNARDAWSMYTHRELEIWKNKEWHRVESVTATKHHGEEI